MLYQRKILATGELLGDPAPLPPSLEGWDAEFLADVSAHLAEAACEQLGFTGQGFFPVPDPDTPAPPAPLRIGKYWLFQRFNEDQERQYAKLEYQARNLTPADLDDPTKEGLFQLQRFMRRLDALTVVELNAAQTVQGFELLRLLGVFGDPADPASQDAMAAVMAPPTAEEWSGQ